MVRFSTLAVAALVLMLTIGCGRDTPKSSISSTKRDISSAKQEAIDQLLAEGRKSEELIALDRQLRAEGYRADEASTIPLFETHRDAILIPYTEPSSSSERIAMAVVRVNGTIRASTFRMRIENGKVIDTISMTVASSGAVASESLGDLSPVAGGPRAQIGCGGDFWCCFWQCVGVNCGLVSPVCLVTTGPAFWACLAIACGPSAYNCSMSCG